MAPELAAGYVIGFIPSLSVTGLHWWLHKRKTRDSKFLQLQSNLLQINKYWCESEASIVDWSDEAQSKDESSFKKSLLLMGILFFFLSRFGFFFNLIVLLSVYYIAISRFEQKVFASDLCQKQLSKTQIEEIIRSLQT